MIWVKTDAGRAEMQSRALVKERARRNLLLLIDGVKTEEMLLANLAGITSIARKRIRQDDHILKLTLVQQDHALPILTVVDCHGQPTHALVG